MALSAGVDRFNVPAEAERSARRRPDRQAFLPPSGSTPLRMVSKIVSMLRW